MGDVITKDIRLYAKWVAPAAPVTISMSIIGEGAVEPGEGFEEYFDQEFMTGDTLDLSNSIPASDDIVNIYNIAAEKAGVTLGTIDNIIELSVNSEPYDGMLTINDTITEILIYAHFGG